MPSGCGNRKADRAGDTTAVVVDEDSLVNTAQVGRMTLEEAERCVRDLCHVVARYCYLAPAIATNKDSTRLRDDLLHLRASAYELARVNKAYLLPRLRTQQSGANQQTPPAAVDSNGAGARVEAIFYTFCACLECLFEHLIRTYDAVASASRQAAAIEAARTAAVADRRRCGSKACSTGYTTLGTTQVNTGLTEGVTVAALNRVNGVTVPGHLLTASYNSQRSSRRSSAAPGATPGAAPSSEPGQYHAKALEELRGLGGDLQAVRDMIFEIHSSISINPWAVCPDLDQAKLDETASLTSLDSGDSAPSNHLVETQRRGNGANSGAPHGSGGSGSRAAVIRTKHQRCLCLSLVILTSIILFAVVLGVCIKMLA